MQWISQDHLYHLAVFLHPSLFCLVIAGSESNMWLAKWKESTCQLHHLSIEMVFYCFNPESLKMGLAQCKGVGQTLLSIYSNALIILPIPYFDDSCFWDWDLKFGVGELWITWTPIFDWLLYHIICIEILSKVDFGMIWTRKMNGYNN